MGVLLTHLQKPFDPSELSGLTVWYDAQDFSTITKDSSGRISQVDNKANVGMYDATQGTSSRQPIHSPLVNGRYGINNEGNSSRYMETGYKIPSEHSVFLVWNTGNAVTGYRSPYGQNDGAGHMAYMESANSGVDFRASVGNTSLWLFGVNFQAETNYLWSLIAYGSGKTFSVWIDKGAENKSSTYTFTGDSIDNVVINSRTSAGSIANGLRGGVSEFIVVNRAVSEEERIKVEAYLTKKWRLA